MRLPDALLLFADHLEIVLEVVDFLANDALIEIRHLQRALRCLHGFAFGIERGERALLRVARGIEPRGEIGQLRAQLVTALRCRGAARRLALLLAVDFAEIFGDLAAAILRTLRLLGQAHMVELQIVPLPLQIFRLLAHAQGLFALLLQLDLGGGRDLAQQIGFRLQLVVAAAELFDLALAGENPMHFGIGGVEAHAVVLNTWPCGHTSTAPGGRSARCAKPCSASATMYTRYEPVGQHQSDRRIGTRDQCEQGLASRQIRRRGIAVPVLKERNLAGRGLRQPARRGLQVVERDRVQPLAQDRFQRIFPTGLDADALPQAAETVELMIVEPRMHFTGAALPAAAAAAARCGVPPAHRDRAPRCRASSAAVRCACSSSGSASSTRFKASRRS